MTTLLDGSFSLNPLYGLALVLTLSVGAWRLFQRSVEARRQGLRLLRWPILGLLLLRKFLCSDKEALGSCFLRVHGGIDGLDRVRISLLKKRCYEQAPADDDGGGRLRGGEGRDNGQATDRLPGQG